MKKTLVSKPRFGGVFILYKQCDPEVAFQIHSLMCLLVRNDRIAIERFPPLLTLGHA
jgi:hypothetical protein